jgi:hypothetical protein
VLEKNGGDDGTRTRGLCRRLISISYVSLLPCQRTSFDTKWYPTASGIVPLTYPDLKLANSASKSDFSLETPTDAPITSGLSVSWECRPRPPISNEKQLRAEAQAAILSSSSAPKTDSCNAGEISEAPTAGFSIEGEEFIEAFLSGANAAISGTT